MESSLALPIIALGSLLFLAFSILDKIPRKTWEDSCRPMERWPWEKKPESSTELEVNWRGR